MTRTEIIKQAIQKATAIRQSSVFYLPFNLANSCLRPLIERLHRDESIHPPKLGPKDLEREIIAVMNDHWFRSRKYHPVFEFILRSWPTEDDSLPPPILARPLVRTPPLVPRLIPPKTVVAFPPPQIQRQPPILITANTPAPVVVAPRPFPAPPTKTPLPIPVHTTAKTLAPSVVAQGTFSPPHINKQPPIPVPITVKTQSPFVVAPVKPPSLPSVQTQAQDVAKSIQAVMAHAVRRSSEVSQRLQRVRLPSEDSPTQWLFRSLGDGQEPEKVLKEGLTYKEAERIGWDPRKYLICMCCYANAGIIGLDGYMTSWVNYHTNDLQVPYLASGIRPDDSQGGKGSDWQYAIDTTAMGLSQPTLITGQVADKLGITPDVVTSLKTLVKKSLGRTDLLGEGFCLSKEVRIRHDPEFKRIVVATYSLKRGAGVGEIDFIGKIEPQFVTHWLVIGDPGNETKDGPPTSSQFMTFNADTVALYKELNSKSLKLHH
jgi:hypothetical protein